MARARNIKPGFFQNEDLADLSFQDRLFFIGLWTICDFKGCMEFRPKRIKVAIMPYDDCDVEQSVKNLASAGFLRIYTVTVENSATSEKSPNKSDLLPIKSEPRQRYLKIFNFEKHQRPHKNEIEAGSDLPDVDKADLVTIETTNTYEESPSESELSPIKSEPLALNTDSLLLNTDSLNPLPPAAKKKTSPPKKKLTTIPEDFDLTISMRAWFVEHCPSLNIESEFNRFKTRCQAKGTEYRDWAAGWRTQMLNAEEWAKPSQRSNGHGTNKPTSEREKSAERSRNSRAALDELERSADARRRSTGLLCEGRPDDPQDCEPG